MLQMTEEEFKKSIPPPDEIYHKYRLQPLLDLLYQSAQPLYRARHLAEQRCKQEVCCRDLIEIEHMLNVMSDLFRHVYQECSDQLPKKGA